MTFHSKKSCFEQTLIWVAFIVALPFLLLFKLYWAYEEHLGEQSLDDSNIALIVFEEDDPTVTKSLVDRCVLNEAPQSTSESLNVYRVAGTSEDLPDGATVPQFIARSETEDLSSMVPGRTQVTHRAIYEVFSTPDPVRQARNWLASEGYSDPEFELASVGDSVSNFAHTKGRSRIAKTIYSQSGGRVFRIDGSVADISEEGAGVAVSAIEHRILNDYLSLAGRRSSATWSGSILALAMSVIALLVAGIVFTGSNHKWAQLVVLMPYAVLWWQGTWTTFWVAIFVGATCLWMAASDDARGKHRTPTYLIFLRGASMMWLGLFLVFYLLGNKAGGRTYFSFADTITVAFFSTAALTLFFRVFAYGTRRFVASDPDFQAWEKSGGHYFWDTMPRLLNPDSDYVRRYGQPDNSAIEISE